MSGSHEFSTLLLPACYKKQTTQIVTNQFATPLACIVIQQDFDMIYTFLDGVYRSYETESEAVR